MTPGAGISFDDRRAHPTQPPAQRLVTALESLAKLSILCLAQVRLLACTQSGVAGSRRVIEPANRSKKPAWTGQLSAVRRSAPSWDIAGSCIRTRFLNNIARRATRCRWPPMTRVGATADSNTRLRYVGRSATLEQLLSGAQLVPM